ncbi:MAG: glycosyltransferase family 9 protein [Puia sp.]|nr:glycosyltransferase family 9 protein [Puia sp.]
MKFLIIRFSSIGDIVLTTPVVRCLKKQVVAAEVHYLTKTSFRPILARNPYIDKIHCLDQDLVPVIEALKEEDFDYVIDLHHNLRTLKVKRALGKKSFSFNKLNIEKWWYTNFKWNRMPDRHIVDRYMDTVRSFGVKNDGAGLDYFMAPEERVKESDIPASHQAGYVGLVIGAALATKKLPFHKLKEICTEARHPLILLGGPEDAETGEALSAIDPFKIYNACGKFSLNESADLVRRAKLVVTHDTGLMHIATAFKRPVLSVWGNTVPEFGMYPYYGENYLSNFRSGRGSGGGSGRSGSVGVASGSAGIASGGVGQASEKPMEAGLDLPYEILEVKGLSCRPCSKIGYKKCPKGHFKCMELQPVDRIVGAINPK